MDPLPYLTQRTSFMRPRGVFRTLNAFCIFLEPIVKFSWQQLPLTQYPGGFEIQCDKELEEEEDGIHTLLQRHQSPSFVREVEEIEGTPAHIKISMAFEPGIVRLSALAVADEICEWPNKLPAFPLFLCAPKTAIQGVARSSLSL